MQTPHSAAVDALPPARPFVLILGERRAHGEARVPTATLPAMPPSSARELAERIGTGDAAAERELYLRYARGLRFLMLARDNDDQLAQDIVQECFRIALQQLRGGRLENPDALAGFLRGIALNLLSEFQRSGRRRPQSDIDSDSSDFADDESASPLEVTTRHQRRTLIRQLIAELPVERDRQLLWRYFVLDQDKSVIGAALQLSPDHFDRVLHRAKTRFRDLAAARGLTRQTDGS